MTDPIETDRGFTVAGSASLPSALSIGDAVLSVDDTVEVVDTYFDTADRRLADVGVFIRRSTGHDNEGWHVGTPSDDGVHLYRTPLGRAVRTVPRQLRLHVQALARDEPLRAHHQVSASVTRYRLADEDGHEVLVLSDQRVIAAALDGTGGVDGGGVTTWREWRVTPAAVDSVLVERFCEAVMAAGAQPTSEQDPLGTLLGLARRVDRPGPARPRKARVHAVVGSQLDTHIRRLRLLDVAVRHDQPDSVHQMRVTVRRLRSLLATYRPLLLAERIEPLGDALARLGDVLGSTRDLEVVLELVLADLERLPDDAVRGDVRRVLTAALTDDLAASRVDLLECMSSSRYWALHDELEGLVTSPPWTSGADTKAVKVLPRLLEREVRRVHKRAHRARRVGSAGRLERDVRLHALRKAAKRLRYAAESAEPVLGKDARRLAKSATRAQRHLGELNDAATVDAHLLRLADRFATAGLDTFTIGVLHARARRRADELARAVPVT